MEEGWGRVGKGRGVGKKIKKSMTEEERMKGGRGRGGERGERKVKGRGEEEGRRGKRKRRG
jgi:hypothetical protein